jgi:hypothetical protein
MPRENEKEVGAESELNPKMRRDAKAGGENLFFAPTRASLRVFAFRLG